MTQALSDLFKVLADYLVGQGYDAAAADILRNLEFGLLRKTDAQAQCEEAKAAVSKLAFRRVQETPASDDGSAGPSSASPPQEALGLFLDQLQGFRNGRYQSLADDLVRMRNEKAPPEHWVQSLLALSFRLLRDYSEERSFISSRLSVIIKNLVLTQREFSIFLDRSIEYFDNDNRNFIDTFSSRLGAINGGLTEGAAEEPDKLLTRVMEEINALFRAVELKVEQDENHLQELKREKESLETRLDDVRRDYDSFVTQSRRLLSDLEDIKSISLKDSLTGIYNRRAYDEQIRMTLDNMAVGKLSSFGLIIFDIDLFRDVNNNYGHQAGDSILAHMGRLVSSALRFDDFVFRYGGDEFIILLPEANLLDTVRVAEKIRTQVETVEFVLFRNSDKSIHITISMGVTEGVSDDTATTVLARADKALYISKQKGRNLVTSS
ncbi:MAG: diguanylate cyclase [Deltaproteobacteria bacterium]|nr:diguanylate cyclase [Deltaproteobacteria bacterium]